MLNFNIKTPKKQLHQSFQMVKFLAYCYNEIVLRAFLSRVSNAKYLAFDTLTSKKALPSNMVNAIISGNNETALFTNGKNYIIFLFRGARFLFLLFFSFSFPCLSSVSHSCSESLQPLLCSLSLPLPLLDDLPPSLTKPRPKHQGKPISIAVVFF